MRLPDARALRSRPVDPGTEAVLDQISTLTSPSGLFVDHGVLLSASYLFEYPLQGVSKAVGLIGPTGWRGRQRGTISAHRFRHTVGTQLAERGAKLHTIMKMLGHSSLSMGLVYAQVSDQEVLRDYKAVLEPGAVIAGPPPTS